MQFTRNLKHIFVIGSITLLLIFGVVRLFGMDFLIPITHFFLYRETGVQSKLYTYDFKPSQDIVIIKIDDISLNTLQAQGNLKMLTIPKSMYIDLIEKLQSVGVKGIAFDIVFQNKDPDEERFAEVMKKYDNIVIATTDQEGECISDNDTPYETCEGRPRSVYRDIQQGYINHSKYLHTYRDRGENLVSKLVSREKTLYPSSLIPYFGLPGSYPSISFSHVLTLSKIDLVKNFAGKYILIGESGTLIHDRHISPVSGTFMDGVEVHAHILDSYLQNRELKELHFSSPIFFFYIVLLIFLITAIALFLPKYISPILTVIILLGLLIFSRYLYFHYGLVIEILPVLLAGGIFSFPVTFIYRFFIIDREKRMITRAFSHYVDPTVVSEIASQSRDINLGGESRELTIFFSDIAGFTSISEKLSPTDLFSLMSSYLSRMTSILTSHGGTLDKYIGDAVMGFFGAPISLDDHAKRACRTALAMQKALPEFNADITTRGLDPIDFRIGIATGDVVVGNIGSYERFNYTVLGDTVNLASRLESTSKEYGTRIIVAESTYLLSKDAFLFRPLDKVAVKGKTEGVMIYELIGSVGDDIDQRKYDTYTYALTLYFSGKYLEAGQLFENNMTDDEPSRVMALRCRDILEGKIVVEGGVYRMTHK